MEPTVTISLDEYNLLIDSRKELRETQDELRKKEPTFSFCHKYEYVSFGTEFYIVSKGIQVLIGKEKLNKELTEAIAAANRRCDSLEQKLTLREAYFSAKQERINRDIRQFKKPWYKRIF